MPSPIENTTAALDKPPKAPGMGLSRRIGPAYRDALALGLRFEVAL